MNSQFASASVATSARPSAQFYVAASTRILEQLGHVGDGLSHQASGPPRPTAPAASDTDQMLFLPVYDGKLLGEPSPTIQIPKPPPLRGEDGADDLPTLTTDDEHVAQSFYAGVTPQAAPQVPSYVRRPLYRRPGQAPLRDLMSREPLSVAPKLSPEPPPEAEAKPYPWPKLGAGKEAHLEKAPEVHLEERWQHFITNPERAEPLDTSGPRSAVSYRAKRREARLLREQLLPLCRLLTTLPRHKYAKAIRAFLLRAREELDFDVVMLALDPALFVVSAQERYERAAEAAREESHELQEAEPPAVQPEEPSTTAEILATLAEERRLLQETNANYRDTVTDASNQLAGWGTLAEQTEREANARIANAAERKGGLKKKTVKRLLQRLETAKNELWRYRAELRAIETAPGFPQWSVLAAELRQALRSPQAKVLNTLKNLNAALGNENGSASVGSGKQRASAVG